MPNLALQQSLEKSALLLSTINTLAQGVAVFDRDMRLMHFNQCYVELLDLPQKLLHPGVGLNDICRYRAERGDYGEGDVQKFVKECEQSAEHTFRDGRVYVHQRRPMPGGGCVVTYTDITAHKQLERSLRESEEQFRKALQATRVGMTMRNIADRTLETNDAFCELVGYSHEELEQMHLKVLTHPEDQQANKKRHSAVIGEEAGPSHISKRMIRKNGEIIWVTTDMAVVRDTQGIPLFTINFYQDITNLKRAETEASEKSALLEMTINTMAQGFAAFDKEGRLIAVNQRFVEMSGLPADLAYLSLPYEELVRFRLSQTDLRGEALEAAVAARLASAKAMKERLDEISRPDGVTYLYHRKPMPTGGFVITLTDISARKTAEEQTRLAAEASEEANRAKSEFLANMSHELRTPLNAIIGFSEVMKNASYGPIGNAKYEEYAGDIFASGRHLLSLINEILDLSKAEAGKMELVEEEFDPTAVTLACMRMVKEQAKKCGVKIVPEISKRDITLRADEKMFRQIVINILSNAIKFTPPQKTVTVKTWAQRTSGYIFQVIDHGIGIEAANIPKILQPFTQLDSAANRKYQGTGLGLPLTKRLIELHGGILDIQSQLGVGTTVTVRFPRERMVPKLRVERLTLVSGP